MTSTSTPPTAPTRMLAARLGWGGQAKIILRVLRHRFREDGIFQLSAALTYNTLFSLLPTFVLALLVISMISSGSNDLGRQAQDWIVSQFGLNQLQITTGNQNQPLDLSQVIAERIQSVRSLVQSPGTGILAFGTLLWGALSLMIVIERAFNRICRNTRQRPWIRRLTLYWCVLTLGPLGVAASLALSRGFAGAVTQWVGPMKWLIAPLTLLAGVWVSWLMVFLAYRIIPETPLRWRSAAVGAVVGALLWELGKYGFGLYVQHSVGARNWYGNLALLPLFMLWIYWTWNFLLVGLQIAHIHEHFKSLARHAGLEDTHAPGHLGLTDFRWVLPLGVLLYRRFQTGRPLRAEEAAEELGLTPDLAAHLLAALQRAKIVYGVEGKERTFALARPPAQITSADLLAASRTLGHDLSDGETRSPDDPRRAPGIVAFEVLEQKWSRSTTLAQLAGDPS